MEQKSQVHAQANAAAGTAATQATPQAAPQTATPHKKGRFGAFGGQYIPETLMYAVQELDNAYTTYKNDPAFNAELHNLLNNYAGRPSLLYSAQKNDGRFGRRKNLP